MKTIYNYAEYVKEQHALNKTIAPVETDATDASQEYAIGQQFILNGDLCRAKTAIAEHDALTLNTNYELADDITTQLSGKQDALTFDNVPTENSNNPVKSGGVFSANQNIYALIGTWDDEVTSKAYASVISVEDALGVNAVDVKAKIEPVQAGSGTPSPTNVRAISGRSAANITRAGKNLISTTLHGYYTMYTGEYVESPNYISYGGIKLKAGTYTFSTDLPNCYITRYFINDTDVEVTATTQTVTFTATEDGIFKISTRNVSTSDISDLTPKAQLESGEEATTFEAFADTYTINLGGTYYGGVLDVTTGELTIDRAIADLGDLTWTYQSEYTRFLADNVPNIKSMETRTMDILCSCYEPISDGRALENVPNYAIYCGAWNTQLIVHDSRYTVGADLKTALAGQKVVYLLATPLTIQLTPQDIMLLQDNNVLYADSGNVSLDYRKPSLGNLRASVDDLSSSVDDLTAENQTLTQQANDIVNVLSAKNILPNNATSQSIAGITYTVNSDGSVRVQGTATAYSMLNLNDGIFLKKGKYIISGCPSGGSASKYTLWIRNLAISIGYTDYGNGVEFSVSTEEVYKTSIIVYSGATVDLTFYPMLRLASMVDATYEPYSMTNRQITPYVLSQSNANLLDNPWFTVNQRGQSSYTALASNTYTADRWASGNNLMASVGVNENGITLTASTLASGQSTELRQRIEDDFAKTLDGKTLTLSVLVNGQIYSVTGVYNYAENETPLSVEIESGISLQIRNIPTNTPRAIARILFASAASQKAITIRAIKLEIGKVSTLALDTAPNYATELLKCQRYFVRFGSNESVNAYKYTLGMAYENANNAYYMAITPVPMRSTPSVTYSGSWAIGSKLLSSMSVNSIVGNIVKLVFYSSDSMTAGKITLLENKESGINYIDLSAEL